VIVVSDSSALSALIDLNKVELLRSLYSQIIIPEAVRDEILRKRPTLPPGIEIGICINKADVQRLEVALGRGEAEAIVLAKEIPADLLLIDERKGRRFATKEGLSIIGVVGFFAVAKQRGLIAAVAPLMDALIKTGFYVSPELRAAILARVGEK